MYSIYHHITKEQLTDLKSSGYYSLFDCSQINSAEDTDERIHQKFIVSHLIVKTKKPEEYLIFLL